MRSKATDGPPPSQEFEYGPLFGGSRDYVHERPQSTAVDPDERLAWARRALLLSNLETFTAETVREFVVQMRPHYVQSGRWIGHVFMNCPLFEKLSAENAKREAAAARTIWRYRLTPEGRATRRNLTSEASNGNN